MRRSYLYSDWLGLLRRVEVAVILLGTHDLRTQRVTDFHVTKTRADFKSPFLRLRTFFLCFIAVSTKT